MTSELVPDHDPVMALLADAMELIASACEEYASRPHEDTTRGVVESLGSAELPIEIVRDETGVATVTRKAVS